MKTARASILWLAGAIALSIFAATWISTGDPVMAFLSFLVATLALALLIAVLGYLSSNAADWWRRLRGVSWSDHLQRLEGSGKAVREHYQATRALTFEDHTCGSLVHLIEIGEGGILCLWGQRYYEFEPRLFPTTSFALLRCAEKQEVLAVFPGAEVFEPIHAKPIRDYRQLRAVGVTLKDGAIIAGMSLDTVANALRVGG
jgi:hypothetical protein